MSPTQPSLIETSLTDEWVRKKLENKNVTLRIGTLFSGIGAIEHALQRLKIKTEIVFAGDIDPFVKEAYFANYDISENHGMMMYKIFLQKNINIKLIFSWWQSLPVFFYGWKERWHGRY